MVLRAILGYNATLSACEKGGPWQLALMLFDGMCKAQVDPDVTSYSVTLSAYEKG